MYDFLGNLDCCQPAPFLVPCTDDPRNAIASGWMHIWHKPRPQKRRADLLDAGVAGMLLGLLAGCASPGPPLAPSLKLPEVVTAGGLAATRVGDEVRLRWTTSTRTTDKLLIVGPVVAVICRETEAGGAPAPAPAKGSAKATVTAPCAAAARLPVKPGESAETADVLPAVLTTGPAGLLAYRVELLNSAGRTAGPSPTAFAASGQAPEPVKDLAGEPTKAGVVLHWRLGAGNGEQGTANREQGTEAIELDRTTLDPTPGKGAESKGGLSGLPGAAKEPVEARFRAGDSGGADAGGTIDRTAEIGHSYRYTAQRVRSVVVGGRTLEMRSEDSAEVSVAVRDVFLPDAPTGLVAAPGFAAEGVENPSSVGHRAIDLAIDLSWEPNVEPRIAGYRVYRREESDGSGEWRLVTPDLVTTAAYRDLKAAAGHRYRYRVTAVDTAGHESPPSAEVVETSAGE